MNQPFFFKHISIQYFIFYHKYFIGEPIGDKWKEYRPLMKQAIRHYSN